MCVYIYIYILTVSKIIKYKIWVKTIQKWELCIGSTTGTRTETHVLRKICIVHVKLRMEK